MSMLAWTIGGWEWVALMAIGLLLFGRRLPEVGKNLGKGIVEFRKGIKGIEDEIEDASSGKPQVAGASATAQPSLDPPAQQTIPHQPAKPAAEPASQPASESPPRSAQADDDADNPYRN